MSGLTKSLLVPSVVALLLLVFGAQSLSSQQSSQALPASGAPGATLIGVVLPSDARPGEPVSATVVTDPNSYANIPGLTVREATVPLAKGANGGASLEGVVIDTGDGTRQPATGPVVFSSVAAGAPLTMRFLRADDGTELAQQSVNLAQTPAPAMTAPPSAVAATDYSSSPVMEEQGVNAIHGPLGGDSTKTGVLVDGAPGHIVAEDPRHVYWQVPPGTAPGAHRVVVEENGRALAAFTEAEIELRLSADTLTLRDRQTTKFRVTVQGGDSIPSGDWQAGSDPTLVSQETIESGKGAAKPPAEGQPGALMLQIENASGDAVSMKGASGSTIAVLLKRDAFASGAYTYNGELTAKRAGGFQINANVIPFLSERAGDEPPAQGGETAKGPATSGGPTTQEKPTETATTQGNSSSTPTTQEKPKGSTTEGGGTPPTINVTDLLKPGKPNIYGHDEIAACPERSKVLSTPCIALVIDFSKNVFYEFDVEKIGSYLGSSHMCETTYLAPKMAEVPKPWKIGVGKLSYTVQPDPKDVQAANAQNAAEWTKINAAINDHRQQLAKGGWEFAIEIINGHGSPKYSFEPYQCGSMSGAFWSGNTIHRADFNQGNYDAARQNVCTWLSADFTCYGGLTPKVVDELNNLGTSTCSQASQKNWPRHAGWDGDGGMSAATDDAPTTNGHVFTQRQNIQSAVVDAFDAWAKAWNSDIWADVDREAMGKQILSNFNSGTGHYTDGGLIKDKAMGCHHTTDGYDTTK